MQQQKAQKGKHVAKKDPGRQYKLHLFALFAFAVVLYSNTIDHGYVLDDHSVIDENFVVKQGAEGIPAILKTSYRYGYWSSQGTLYRPLSLIMFALEWELAPNNPQVSHLVNIVLYGLTAMLLFVVLNNLFREHRLLALLATLLFIAHPLHTEVVANIKGRDDILCFLFLLTSILLLLRYVDSKKLSVLVLSWLSFFLAFLSKENAVTFVAVFPLMLYFFRETKLKSMVLPMVGFVAVTGIYLALRYQVLGTIGGVDVSRIDNSLAGSDSIGEWFATATLILGKYLLLLFFPHPLVNDYAYNQIPLVEWGNIWVIISALLILVLLVFSIIRFKTKSILVFGILLAVISVSIYTNYFITIGTHFAERLLYIPVLGFSIVVAWALLKFFPVPKAGGLFSSRGLMAVMGIILLLMAGKTMSRNAAWESDLVLHQTDIEVNDRSARIHYFLGLEVMKVLAMEAKDEATQHRYLNEAVGLFNRALEIYPSYYHVYNQLGLAYYRLGEFDQALQAYEIGTEHVPQAIGLSNMGAIHFKKREYAKALELYEQAVRQDPRFADGWFNLGSTYGMLKEYQKSIDAFLNGLQYEPDHLQMNLFLGQSYGFLNDAENAKKYDDRAKMIQNNR